MPGIPKQPRFRLDSESYRRLCQQVLERDQRTCQYCGSRSQLQIHHIQPRSRGGDDTEENLMAVCYKRPQRIHAEGVRVGAFEQVGEGRCR